MPSDAAALLDRATARTAPTAADAKENAEIARDLFIDLAQDPYGWRAEIPEGGVISDTIAKTAAEHIDAFSGSNTGSKPEVYPAAEIAEGFLSQLELAGRDAEDVLTFVAAGREPGTPDKDLIALHTAAQAYTRHQVMQAIAGELDPSTALIQAGSVANAVNTADFRSAMHADESVDAAWPAVYDDVSAVAGIPPCHDVEFAARVLLGRRFLLGRGRRGGGRVSASSNRRRRGSTNADRHRAPAGSRRQPSDRQCLPAGRCASGRHPDLDAVTDETGQVSASLRYVDVDHANPEPRTPLDSELVDSARRSDRYGDLCRGRSPIR
jgi:hypothetical protein